MGVKCGSLFSGVGGLDMAVCRFFGAAPIWFSEFEANPSRVLATRYPSVPNLGDITKIDWSHVERPDIICGGFPCQPISNAGRRKVKQDSRWLWPAYAESVRVLRPRFVVVENVSALLRPWRDDEGLWNDAPIEEVLRDLDSMGYVGRWGSLRASYVGAPHRRERVFILAVADTGGDGREWVFGTPSLRRQLRDESLSVTSSSGSPSPASHAEHDGRDGRSLRRGVREGEGERGVLELEGRGSPSPTDATSQGRGRQGRSGEAIRGPEAVEQPGRRDRMDWRDYEPAIRRWERVLNRPAPSPVDEQKRLSPAFCEWMMGFDEGWVTEILDRNPAIKALGNAVVPQQAYRALELLEVA